MKPLSEITEQDVRDLVAEKRSEGQDLELKGPIPHNKKNQRHPWYSGKREVGEYARNQILDEVVAMANAQGGFVIVGIEESKTKPHRAESVLPIPDIHELAYRLKQQCQECIEPLIPHLDARGIETEASGDGVVVIESPRSLRAPHRLIPTGRCSVRRNDETVRMTMIEIQDLTLHTANWGSQIDAAFAMQADQFQRKIRRLLRGSKTDALLGMRATAIPLTPLSIRNISLDKVSQRQFESFSVVGSTTIRPATLGYAALSWRPMLRGVVGRSSDEASAPAYVELHNDGLVEIGFHSDFTAPEGVFLTRESAIGLVCSALRDVLFLREMSDSSSIEYGLEIEFRAFSGELYVTPSAALEDGWKFIDSSVFPRYSVPPEKDAMQGVIALFQEDFWHSLGVSSFRVNQYIL